jgi:hypothetical protein
LKRRTRENIQVDRVYLKPFCKSNEAMKQTKNHKKKNQDDKRRFLELKEQSELQKEFKLMDEQQIRKKKQDKQPRKQRHYRVKRIRGLMFCIECNTFHNRDTNAAKYMILKGLEQVLP